MDELIEECAFFEVVYIDIHGGIVEASRVEDSEQSVLEPPLFLKLDLKVIMHEVIEGFLTDAAPDLGKGEGRAAVAENDWAFARGEEVVDLPGNLLNRMPYHIIIMSIK